MGIKKLSFYKPPSINLCPIEHFKVIENGLNYLEGFFRDNKEGARSTQIHFSKFYYKQGKIYLENVKKERDTLQRKNYILQIQNAVSFLVFSKNFKNKKAEELLKELCSNYEKLHEEHRINIVNNTNNKLNRDSYEIMGGDWIKIPEELLVGKKEYCSFKLFDFYNKRGVSVVFQCENCKDQINIKWEPHKSSNITIFLSNKNIEFNVKNKYSFETLFHSCLPEGREKK
jgi:hypothetical protein